MITVAQAMVKCLEEENVSVVFGYPGAAICPFYEALSHSDIRHILVRQEQNSGHAANGYARITGRPGVCIATSGPGATNLITGIATAYMDSIPLVAITGQVNSDQIGRDVFQEADITGAAEPFVKHSYLVKKADDIPRIFKEAFHIAATGRPGPVLIDVPMDVQKMSISFDYPEKVNIRSYKPSVRGHEGQIKRVMESIMSSQRPLLCAGGGVFWGDAQKYLLEFVEKMDVPVITTMMGIGCIPSRHALNFGMIGNFGVKEANYALNHADLLILIGARVADRAVSSPERVSKNAKIIHIDVDPAEIGKNMQTNIPVVGDAAVILKQLLKTGESLQHTEWVQKLTAKKTENGASIKAEEGYVNPKKFMRLLSSKADEDSIVVADVGQNQIWTSNYYEVKKGRFFTSGGLGTMGFSIPAAIGTKIGTPKRQVIAICGDGSFQMQMMELATMCQHDVAIKIVVMKNNYLGMVREVQTKQYDDNLMAVSLKGSPDFVKLAQAYGIPSQVVTSHEDAEKAIEAALAADTPYLLEVHVSPYESTL